MVAVFGTEAATTGQAPVVTYVPSQEVTGQREVALVSAPVVSALEHTWAEIRARHAELPEVVLVLASGSIGMPAGTLKLGHYAATRWSRGDDSRGLPEVFVGGEGLALGPVAVLGTLLHEAAHALAHIRGIRDTSRAGRYHNSKFAGMAGHVGLSVSRVGQLGWSDTSVPEFTISRYCRALELLSSALTIYRYREPAIVAAVAGAGTTDSPTSRGRKSNNNGVSAQCTCGRRIRLAVSVLVVAPIICARCNTPFSAN